MNKLIEGDGTMLGHVDTLSHYFRTLKTTEEQVVAVRRLGKSHSSHLAAAYKYVSEAKLVKFRLQMGSGSRTPPAAGVVNIRKRRRVVGREEENVPDRGLASANLLSSSFLSKGKSSGAVFTPSGASLQGWHADFQPLLDLWAMFFDFSLPARLDMPDRFAS